MAHPRRPPHAAGGVLVDAEVRILLRRPANDYGGYVWSYPKGRIDDGETPEQAALREVREEAGWEAEIVSRIPGPGPGGDFLGDTTVTRFFLMRPLRQLGPPDPAETKALCWALPSEARALIAETRSTHGRRRDLAVLELAVHLLSA